MSNLNTQMHCLLLLGVFLHVDHHQFSHGYSPTSYAFVLSLYCVLRKAHHLSFPLMYVYFCSFICIEFPILPSTGICVTDIYIRGQELSIHLRFIWHCYRYRTSMHYYFVLIVPALFHAIIQLLPFPIIS